MRQLIAAFFVTLILAAGCIGMVRAWDATSAVTAEAPVPAFFLREQDESYTLTLAGRTASLPRSEADPARTDWLPVWLRAAFAAADRLSALVVTVMTEPN